MANHRESTVYELISLPDERGCMLWLGRVNDDGYGVVGSEKAHRVVFTLFNGPIPDGLSVLHECDNPPCVAPLHLFPGTQQDNMRDMARKRRGVGQDRTHCRTCGEGLVVVDKKNGKRGCVSCRRARSRAWHAERRAA